MERAINFFTEADNDAYFIGILIVAIVAYILCILYEIKKAECPFRVFLAHKKCPKFRNSAKVWGESCTECKKRNKCELYRFCDGCKEQNNCTFIKGYE